MQPLIVVVAQAFQYDKIIKIYVVKNRKL
jgi:hypothetical protein